MFVLHGFSDIPIPAALWCLYTISQTEFPLSHAANTYLREQKGISPQLCTQGLSFHVLRGMSPFHLVVVLFDFSFLYSQLQGLYGTAPCWLQYAF